MKHSEMFYNKHLSENLAFHSSFTPSLSLLCEGLVVKL